MAALEGSSPHPAAAPSHTPAGPLEGNRATLVAVGSDGPSRTVGIALGSVATHVVRRPCGSEGDVTRHPSLVRASDEGLVHEVVSGPVAVTGAGGHVGRALLRRLAGLPNEVRALGRGDDPATAFRDAAAVVHLAGTLRPRRRESYVDANLRTVERTIAALAGSAVERVVFLSYVGADPASRNEYLRTKGRAERLLYGCGRDVVVLRCTHVYGPPEEPGPTVAALLAASGETVVVLGSGEQRVAPVHRDDVVEAIVTAALDPRAPHGRFDLPGPDVVTMDEFVRIVNRRPATLRHVAPLLARALAHLTPGLMPALVDVMLADSLGEGTRVDRAFGLDRRRLADVYPPATAAAA